MVPLHIHQHPNGIQYLKGCNCLQKKQISSSGSQLEFQKKNHPSSIIGKGWPGSIWSMCQGPPRYNDENRDVQKPCTSTNPEIGKSRNGTLPTQTEQKGPTQTEEKEKSPKTNAENSWVQESSIQKTCCLDLPNRQHTYSLRQGSVCNVCHPGGSFHFQIVMSVDLGFLGTFLGQSQASWSRSSVSWEPKVWCLQPSDARWKLPSVIPGTPRLVAGASLEVQFSEWKNYLAGFGCFDVFHAIFRFKNFLGKPSKTLSSNARFARLVQFAQFALSEHAAQASRQSWEVQGTLRTLWPANLEIFTTQKLKEKTSTTTSLKGHVKTKARKICKVHQSRKEVVVTAVSMIICLSPIQPWIFCES